MNKKHELFSSKNRKVFGIFKIQTLKNVWKDKFICLGSKAYSFKGTDKNTKNLRSFSKSKAKNIEFQEKFNCFFGGEYQKEWDIYPMRSIYLQRYFGKLTKISLSGFDEKRKYLNNSETYHGFNYFNHLQFF